MKEKNRSQQRITRRQFLKLAAATGVLVGCTTQKPIVTAILSPTAAPTPPPAAKAVPPRPEIIKFFPDGPSRVVRASHSGVWNGEDLVPTALRQMLDAAITKLTGLEEPRKSWAALFSPKETIAIKVNTIRNSLFWTHVPLVTAVVEALQEAGIPPEQVVIYDRTKDELVGAGYTINESGSGVRCRATGSEYDRNYKVADRSVGLSKILLDCDALINMPILKSHLLCGVTFAMKNHYGTFDQPEKFHEHSAMMRAIPELNALAPIKDRQRLIIGDALVSTLKEATSWPYWRDPIQGDSIFMSFDPVACDAVGLEHWIKLKEAHGEDTQAALALARPWLKSGADLGVGTDDLANIDAVEIKLVR